MDLCASFSKLNPSAKMSLNLFRISLCLAISVDKIHLQIEINTEFSLTDNFNITSLVSLVLSFDKDRTTTRDCGFVPIPFPTHPMKCIETTP